MLIIRRDNQIHREEDAGFVLRFHFSFKDYQDPAYDGFGALRLFNDDSKNGLFTNQMHPHTDLEIVTYIVEGTFRHEDSLGNSFLLPSGALESFSFGTGAEHAEHNASETEPLRMLLFYFVPDMLGLPPSVTHAILDTPGRRDRWRRIAGPPGSAGTSVVIHQAVNLYAASLTPQTELRHLVMSQRGAYLYLIAGDAKIDHQVISTGDAVMITHQPFFDVEALTPCDFLLIDVPLLTVSAETDAAIKGDVQVTNP